MSKPSFRLRDREVERLRGWEVERGTGILKLII